VVMKATRRTTRFTTRRTARLTSNNPINARKIKDANDANNRTTIADQGLTHVLRSTRKRQAHYVSGFSPARSSPSLTT
jgi:hypothetical protein